MMLLIYLIDLILLLILFEYIIKKHETIANNTPVLIYVNKTKNKIIFKIKSGYKLEFLSKETMGLYRSR